MKSKFIQLVIPLVLTSLIGVAAIFYTPADRNSILMKVIIQGLSYSHYSPGEIDDQFSEKVYDLYLKQLDSRKRFFTKQDIGKLSQYKHRIDDQINEANYDFLNNSIQLLNKRLEESKCIVNETLAQPFDFSKDELVNLDYENIDYAANDAALRTRWEKTLKYQVLSRLVDEMDLQEKEPEEGEEKKEIKSFEVLEKESRERVAKSYTSMYSSMEKLDMDDRTNAFLNSMTQAYDPHTGYFPPEDKENFDISISGRLEGIGARLTERDGYITVTDIVPGSACWKQGELKEEDVVLKVAQGKTEPVDVVDMKLDDAVKLIRGKKGSEVRLTIKKLDGAVKIIPIIRDVVELEESYARSTILQEGSEKVGYIKLPKFYTPFNKTEGRSCFEDVRTELTKLKKANVSGVVLDLRNNGGGSLHDVVDMAGLFIEKGPIVQVQGRKGKPDIFTDTDSSIHYDGPLVIMVNTFSASASEILAAAMQDYGRAVIVGSATTYGKGTVQRFIDLDRAVPATYAEVKPLGAVKLTIQKFYRIDGGTNQLKGVIPDIVLPDIYHYIDIGEKQQDYAMNWDEIAPLDYRKWNQPIDLNRISSNSAVRIQNNPTFNLIEENAKRLKQQRDKQGFALCLDSYRTEKKQLQEENKRYEAIEKEIKGFSTELLKEDMADKTDAAKKESTEKFLETVSKDAYIYEAMQVVGDM